MKEEKPKAQKINKPESHKADEPKQSFHQGAAEGEDLLSDFVQSAETGTEIEAAGSFTTKSVEQELGL